MIRDFFLTKDLKPNYLYLLITFFIMITFPVLHLAIDEITWIFHICYSLVILTSIIYAYTKKKKISLGAAIGILAFITFWAETFVDNQFTMGANLIFNFLFFIFLLNQVIFETIREKNVTLNTLYAVSVGYFILGMMGFWLLTFLDILAPESFIGNVSNNRSYDLMYYSFVTLTSVGYGDIHTINAEGKAISLLIGIIGQLYVSFTIALIVGKYLNQKN